MQKIIIVDALSALRVKLETERPQDFLNGVLNTSRVNQFAMKIWVWDGKGGNQRRRDIFPAYKSTRPKNPDVIKAMDFVRELIGLTDAWQIRVPGYEGDDVVAALVQHFLATTDLSIQVDCRDGDLVALNALSNRVTNTHKPRDNVPPNLIRLYKAYIGDPSDDIPGLKGFGKGGWEKGDHVALGRILAGVCHAPHDWTEGHQNLALAAGISKASCTWLSDEENRRQWAIMKRIIDPIEVPKELLNEHLKQGKNDYNALNEHLKTFMLVRPQQ